MRHVYTIAMMALLALLTGTARPSLGQHHAHPLADTLEQAIHPPGYPGQMPSVLSRNHPNTRDGSGTTWHPDASVMYGLHKATKNWHHMLHGRGFWRYTYQDMFSTGQRGDFSFGAGIWLMGMSSRPLSSRTRLAIRVMLTSEPFTEGLEGYPLLFQTGETFNGEPLVDQQHPHDLFGELSVTLSHQVGPETDLFFYTALPGEPAFGPPAFMHRPSSQHLPDAPLGHHWQDATHVTFGVATLGIIHRSLKIDASVFTGREPNEERYGFDKPRFDSFSGRAAVNIGHHWALQLSQAFLRSPEAHATELDIWRTAASVLYGSALGNGAFSAAAVWGFNNANWRIPPTTHPHSDGFQHQHGGFHADRQHAWLVEADYKLPATAFFFRLERVQKGGSELRLQSFQDRLFEIDAMTLGLAQQLFIEEGFDVMVGLQLTTYRVPKLLISEYGRRPVSGQVYLRFELR